uniref:Protein kinase domain-containing protein n=1 Tax=Ditylum brightwellii TaxID=49249 RepID=A0A7S4SGN8_9STRA
MENTHMDALVMGTFTSNPLIVNMYAHCATTVLTEFMGGANVEDIAILGSGQLHGRPYDSDSKNDLTVEQKLDIALLMAKAIASLHGFKGGVIVHNDIQLCQFLYNEQGELKMGDFNRAEVMLFDEKNKEYCRYQNGEGWGNYRSYEEYWDLRINEKIDVLSMGNNIYALLTGQWIYPDSDDQVAKETVKEGILPYIDPGYRTKSYIEGQLVEIMYRCFVSKANDRADIFEVVEFLSNTKKEHERRKANNPHYKNAARY